jgi:ribosomal RNA-processing protein 9
MTYIDTLYGHQSEVMGVDSLYKERAISCGRDKSVRVWKVVEETQLVFRGHTASIDCVSFVNEEQFVSGSEDGSIALWSSQKKKPVALLKDAHGTTKSANPDLAPTSNWITSITAFRNSDIFASGSHDGFIKLWSTNSGSKGHLDIKPIVSIPTVS